MVKDLDETDVAKELATSFAPRVWLGRTCATQVITDQCSTRLRKQTLCREQKCNHIGEGTPSCPISVGTWLSKSRGIEIYL